MSFDISWSVSTEQFVRVKRLQERLEYGSTYDSLKDVAPKFVRFDTPTSKLKVQEAPSPNLLPGTPQNTPGSCELNGNIYSYSPEITLPESLGVGAGKIFKGLGQNFMKTMQQCEDDGDYAPHSTRRLLFVEDESFETAPQAPSAFEKKA